MIAVSATAKDQQVDLKWGLVIGAVGYQISCHPAPPSGSGVSLGATQTTHSFTGLTNGVTYTFTVVGKNATGATMDSGTASATPTSGAPTQPPVAEISVALVPGDGQLSATWTPAMGAVEYVASIAPAAVNPTTTSTLGPVVFTGLQNGTAHTVQVIGRSPTGATVGSGTATGTPTAGSIGPTTFPLDLSGGLLDALTPLDADVTGLLASATGMAMKWRYDFLRAQAVSGAQAAAVFEQQITELMALDLAKLGTAELLVGDLVGDIFKALEEIKDQVKNLGTKVNQLAPDLNAQAAALADAVNRLVLLERLLTWLTQQSAVGFWVGLFGALIDDVAAFDTKLPRVSDYLRRTFATSDIGDAVVALLGDAQAKLMAQVDSLAGPLRESVAQMVEEAGSALRRVFASFDAPLIVNTAPVPTQQPGSIPSVPGLGPLSAELAATVDKVVAEVRARVNQALAGANSAMAARELFVIVVVTYLVLPILAALVIAIAGGPLSAAALAAAVTLAAQELVHLVARLLSGPLLSQLDAARAAVDEATRALQATVAKAFEGELGDVSGAVPKAEFLAAQLGSLREELPSEYLHEAARLLGQARDATLRVAAGMALAAEQAIGMETGTVYDIVRADYGGAPATVARAPGGRDPNRFSAAALLRDLDRLEQARLHLADGKQLRVTQRLSLAELLGGPSQQAAFQSLLAGEEVAVRLSEELLLDQAHPGLYCALIDDVRLSAVFAGPAPSVGRSLPVHVTHLGESRTRVRVDSNPAVANLPVAPAFRLTSRRFALQLVTEQLLGNVVGLWVTIQWLQSLEIYWVHRPEFNLPDPAQWVRARAREIEPAMAEAEELNLIVPAIVALLEASAKNQSSAAPGWVLFRQASALGNGVLVEYLRSGRLPDGTVVGRGVGEVAARAHRVARARRDVRNGKWAGTYLEEDRDPTIGSLGFATLVRNQPTETSVFDLVAGSPLHDLATSLPGPATPLPLSSAQAAQYRPFENRGLGGTLLLRLPTAGPGPSPTPTDLLLEVTYRAYHSADLEAAVGMSREQRRGSVDVAANTVGGGTTLIEAPQPLRRRATGRRTIHLSLRAHRDRTLALWQSTLAAYRAVNSTPPSDGAEWDELETVAPLDPSDPWTALPVVPPSTSFALAFAADAIAGGPAVGTNGAALGGLARRVVLTPAMLGLPIASVPVPAQARIGLAGISIALVPTAAGARRRGTHTKMPLKWMDPLAPITLRVQGPAALLLPDFSTARPLGARLIVPPYEPGDEPVIGLDALFATAGAPSLTFELGSTAGDGLLYDIIIGLTFTAPVDEVTLRP